MDIDTNSKTKIKNKIKYNSIINAENNKIVARSRLIIQAAIQYLIEQNIEIFNPFAVLFDPSEFENRNIKHFLSMVRSKSFFHTNTLKSINFVGKTIYIGSYEDFKDVMEIWLDEKDTQKYKLNSYQKKILDLLPEKTRDDAIDDNEVVLVDYKAVNAKEKAEILDEQFTRKKISKLINVSDTTVRNYLDRSQGTAKSLVDMGLVGRLRFNAENNNSPWVYYRVKSEEEDEKTPWQGWQIENATHFNTLENKIIILLSLLYLANISVNEKGYTFLKKYCESKNHCIDITDYNSYYNFINDAISNFKFDEYAVEIEDAKLSDLTYTINLFDEANQKAEKNEGTPSNQDSADFAKQEKIDESGQNDDTNPVSYGNSDLPSFANQQDIREIFGSDIEDPDYAAKICELLVHQDLTREAIFNELHPDVLIDLEIRLEYEQEFSEMIYELMNIGFITITESDDGINYYHLNEDLKKKLN